MEHTKGRLDEVKVLLNVRHLLKQLGVAAGAKPAAHVGRESGKEGGGARRTPVGKQPHAPVLDKLGLATTADLADALHGLDCQAERAQMRKGQTGSRRREGQDGRRHAPVFCQSSRSYFTGTLRFFSNSKTESCSARRRTQE